MPRYLRFLTLIGLAIPLNAQAARPQISAAQARQFETALAANPADRAARSALLDHYFFGRLDAAVAIPARRRHILWMIQNTPGDPLAGSSAATIDATGH